MTEGRLYIGGELKVSSGERTFATINPANEEVICQVAQADRADVDDAVAAARAGFEAWSALDANERGRLLWKIAEAIEGDGDELARLDCIDSGKPIADAREDVHAAVNMFRYFAGMADKIEGSTIPASNSKLVYTLREPYGVVAAITAWNYPLFNACAKIAPVLAAGNSCVLKPAEETPLTAIRLAQVIAAVEGVPTGLLNVINGPGETTGAMLVAHEGVNRITFTGSTQTGQDILKNVGNNTVKGLTLELGGKAPVIVCGDANLEAAANAITFSAFYNQGQTCTAATRVIVEESVHDALLERLVDQAKFVEVGDPASDDTILGPIISKVQYEKILGYLERAESAGLRPKCGGSRGSLELGYYLLPTIFDDVPPSSELFLEEIFGPILTITTFTAVEEAIVLANTGTYGLASSIWTKDVFRLHKIAKELRAGIVWANTLFSEFPGAPAGGVGSSGFGREYGFETMHEYTQLKTVWVDLENSYSGWQG